MESSTYTDTSPAFDIDQYVVYPLQGVGKIISIENQEFKGNQILYYEIYLEISDMTVMVPVAKADDLGIRRIVGKGDSKKALKHISKKGEPVTADWKMRYQMNLDLLKSGSIMDIATVVRTLYHRSKIKELPIQERKLFDNAMKILVDELSISLDKSKTDIEDMVFNSLESE